MLWLKGSLRGVPNKVGSHPNNPTVGADRRNSPHFSFPQQFVELYTFYNPSYRKKPTGEECYDRVLDCEEKWPTRTPTTIIHPPCTQPRYIPLLPIEDAFLAHHTQDHCNENSCADAKRIQLPLILFAEHHLIPRPAEERSAALPTVWVAWNMDRVCVCLGLRGSMTFNRGSNPICRANISWYPCALDSHPTLLPSVEATISYFGIPAIKSIKLMLARCKKPL